VKGCDPLIHVEGVSFGYTKSEMVIKNLNLDVRGEMCTAIIGPNGGGKTTLGKLMAGILKPLKGKVLVDGLNTREVELCLIGEKIGYLFQEPERQIFAPSVKEEIAFAMEIKGVEQAVIESKVETALKSFQLKELEDAFPFKLSRGEKQRLAIAAIMVNNPSFFILDEPTTGLDVERKGILSSLLHNLLGNGIGMVIISHDLTFVGKHAQRIISFNGGEVTYDGASLP
jgi:energy-coupling factor transport system ATP-binding protein